MHDFIEIRGARANNLKNVTRKAPALINVAWGESFFWDGRSSSLEEQAGKPIENPDEMDLPLAEAVARVAQDEGYVAASSRRTKAPPTEESLRKAIASFVRTLVSGNSPYDRHLRGDDASFGEAEKRAWNRNGGSWKLPPRDASRVRTSPGTCRSADRSGRNHPAVADGGAGS